MGQQKTKKILNLASLLVNTDGAFDTAFTKTLNENKAPHTDLADTLLTNKFVIDSKEYSYSDSDPIFFIRQPAAPKKLQNCQTCQLPLTVKVLWC